MKKNKIVKYCSSKDIRVADLAQVVNVNVSQLYKINNDTRYKIKAETMEKIYQGTKKKYKDPLRPKDYSDFSCFK